MTFGQLPIGTILRYVAYAESYTCATAKVIEQDKEHRWTRVRCKCGMSPLIMSDLDISPQRTILYDTQNLKIDEW